MGKPRRPSKKELIRKTEKGYWVRKMRGAMIRSAKLSRLAEYVKIPSACHENELLSFYELVVEGGQVDEVGLYKRIIQSKLLGFFYYKSELVGVAALKQPSSTYRSNVFRKANVLEEINKYDLEIGYASTKPDFQGKGICKFLIRALLHNSGTGNVFATTGNPSMIHILEIHGFKKFGHSYQGSYNDDLNLYMLER